MPTPTNDNPAMPPSAAIATPQQANPFPQPPPQQAGAPAIDEDTGQPMPSKKELRANAAKQAEQLASTLRALGHDPASIQKTVAPLLLSKKQRNELAAKSTSLGGPVLAPPVANQPIPGVHGAKQGDYAATDPTKALEGEGSREMRQARKAQMKRAAIIAEAAKLGVDPSHHDAIVGELLPHVRMKAGVIISRYDDTPLASIVAAAVRTRPHLANRALPPGFTPVAPGPIVVAPSHLQERRGFGVPTDEELTRMGRLITHGIGFRRG